MVRRLFHWKRLLLIFALVIVIAGAGFVVWANNPLPATPDALESLQSDSFVSVSQVNGWYVFQPSQTPPTTGLIFYPGGRVDPRAYAPHLHAIASDGYLVVLVPMPLNLAVFGAEQGTTVMQAFPAINHWAIGGHSLGGAMAARFVQSNPNSVQGLVLWASFPDIDLSSFNLKAASIYGTDDGLAASSVVLDSASRLPGDAVFTAIEGGNHSQFGSYGFQPGDNPASVSPAEQQSQIVSASRALLQQVGEEG